MAIYRPIMLSLTALLIFGSGALEARAQESDTLAFLHWTDLPPELSEVPSPPTPEEVTDAGLMEQQPLPIESGFLLSPSGFFKGEERVQSSAPDKVPLTPQRKFRLAMTNAVDPLNLVTGAAQSAIDTYTSGANSAYGTGRSAFAKRFGTTMNDEFSGEFFQTFFFPSIFRQDPHYHRDLGAKTSSRIVYALCQVLITRSDSGHKTFNYGEVLGSFAAASLGNVYHLDRAQGFGPTSQRVSIGIASDSAWNLFTEFWPDVAKHLNFRMVFLRQLAEHAAGPD